jgi:hypothetical protein
LSIKITSNKYLTTAVAATVHRRLDNPRRQRSLPKIATFLLHFLFRLIGNKDSQVLLNSSRVDKEKNLSLEIEEADLKLQIRPIKSVANGGKDGNR